VFKSQSGQGMAEYVLLIGIIVVVALALKPKITDFINGKFGKASDSADAVFQP
jgi:Flp pilus assembly pilin Flp